jgi:hypothetical protein
MDTSILLTPKEIDEKLEFKYQRRAWAYFGPILRRLKVSLPREIDAEMEDRLESRLTRDEFDELFRLTCSSVDNPDTIQMHHGFG